jgi:hypothetical protein
MLAFLLITSSSIMDILGSMKSINKIVAIPLIIPDAMTALFARFGTKSAAYKADKTPIV